MSAIINQRIAAKIEGDFVVSLNPAKQNQWRKVYRFIPVVRAMRRMIEELKAKPELGLLHVEQWNGQPSLMVQYWRSFEHLHHYARQRDAEHLPAWADFNRKIGSNGDIGIWHETYLVKADQYEAIYNNMPEFGLTRASKWEPASGTQNTAKGRLKMTDGTDEPISEKEKATT